MVGPRHGFSEMQTCCKALSVAPRPGTTRVPAPRLLFSSSSFSVSSFFFFLFFFLPCAWRIRGRQCLEPVDAAEFARRLEVLTLERRAAAGTSGGTSGRFGGGLGGGLGFGRFAPVETG